MKPNKIFEVLDIAMQAREKGFVFNPLFVGPPGVGKSQIVQEWAAKHSLPLIDLRAAYLEAPDMIGFPSIETQDGRQVTKHNLPEFWPDGRKEPRGVLLLEEPNRGTTSVTNTFMQLLTDRTVHKYKLPDGWIIVGCINPEGGECDVNTMDAALKDRFEIYKVAYDRTVFVNYMKETNWNKEVINFVHSSFQYKTPEEIANNPGAKYVSPRTFSKLNALLHTEFNREDEMEHYQTILGTNVGADFYQFRHDDRPVLYEDIRSHWKQAESKLKRFSDSNNLKGGMLSVTVGDILDRNEITDEELAKVLMLLPVDHGTGLIEQLEGRRKDDTILTRICKNHPEVKKQFKEVINFKGNRA